MNMHLTDHECAEFVRIGNSAMRAGKPTLAQNYFNAAVCEELPLITYDCLKAAYRQWLIDSTWVDPFMRVQS